MLTTDAHAYTYTHTYTSYYVSLQWQWQWLLNLLLISLVACIAAAWRIRFVFQQMKHNRRTRNSQFHTNGSLMNIMNSRSRSRSRGTARTIRTVVVLGSGGHTTEMLHLLSSITFVRSQCTQSQQQHTAQHTAQAKQHISYAPLHYIVAASDTTSVNKLTSFDAQQPPEKKLLPHESIYPIPRARHVGQSYLSSILTTLYSLLATAHIVLIQTQPDLLLLNGPGTCLPICIWTIVGRILGICRGRIIFCESFCRVKTLSLTGRILYSLGMVDLFLVHWEELADYLNHRNGKVEQEEEAEAECVLLESFMKKS